jgi:hypothetical protein
MSYVPTDPETNQNAPQGQTTNAPGQTAGMPPPQSGGSTGGGQAAGTPSGASNGSSTQFGSSASKLGDYLSANAPQIQGQANTVASGLNTQYGQVGQDISNAANNFGQQVQGGYAAPNQTLVNEAASNPTGFVSTPGNVSAFQGQLNDTYTGPTSFEGTTPYSNIQNEVNTATQNAGLLGTQAGLQNYLGSTQGGNQTQASNTLDTLLLEGNPQAQQTVNNAAQQFQTLPGQLGTATTAQDQSVAAAQQAAQQAAQYAQGQINPIASQFQTGLTNQLNGVNANEAAYNKDVTGNQTAAQNLQNQLLAAQQAAIAQSIKGDPYDFSQGPNAGMYQGIFNRLTDPSAGINGLSPYLSGQPLTQPGTLANTATTPQYQEDAALAQLLGSGYTPSLNQANIGQAGTYSVPGAPGTVPTDAGLLSYLGDVGTAFGNNAYPILGGSTGKTGWQDLSAQQYAQNALPMASQYGQQNNTVFMDALNRLAANQYAGVGGPQLQGQPILNGGPVSQTGTPLSGNPIIRPIA